MEYYLQTFKSGGRVFLLRMSGFYSNYEVVVVSRGGKEALICHGTRELCEKVFNELKKLLKE